MKRWLLHLKGDEVFLILFKGRDFAQIVLS